jgi:predicted DNA-binding helix-hairpin-helix protein
LLLRIPGLGDRAIDRIVRLRQQQPIGVAEVRKLRVNWHQVRYFVATSDHCPRQTVPERRATAVAVSTMPLSQLPLFDGANSQW